MPRLRFSLPVPFLAAFLAGVSVLQAQLLPVPQIVPVANVDIETQPGHTYTLQRSLDMTAWTDAGRVFGTGADMTFSLEALGGAEYLRVRDDTRPAGGLAPWSLDGLSLTVARDDGSHHWLFSAGGNGQLTLPDEPAAEPFTWTWLRTGENTGCMTASLSGKQVVLHLTWERAGLGRVEEDIRVAGHINQACSGCFHTGTAVAPVSGSELVPGHLLLAERGSTDLLSGTGAPAVTWQLARNGSTSPCGLSLTGSTISLTLPDGSLDFVILTFTGTASGTFTRQTVRNGVFLDTDTGVFCAAP